VSVQFLKGIEEFNNGSFFEAHDAWEELWVETRGEARLFYQGLIHAAAGFYHLENGNHRGACSQLTKALLKLKGYLPAYYDVDTARLVESLEACLHDAERLKAGDGAGMFDPGKIPKIHLL
jgi:predicted metal-dependent hydrolase